MSDTLLLAIRWAARLSALVLAAMFTLMVAAEFTAPHSGPPDSFLEWAGIGLLAAVVGGAILAWKWELTGASLSLLSLIIFAALMRIRADIVIVACAMPGLLFLADYAMRHSHFATHRH